MKTLLSGCQAWKISLTHALESPVKWKKVEKSGANSHQRNMGAAFHGAAVITLDAKGRIAIPTRHRSALLDADAGVGAHCAPRRLRSHLPDRRMGAGPRQGRGLPELQSAGELVEAPAARLRGARHARRLGAHPAAAGAARARQARAGGDDGRPGPLLRAVGFRRLDRRSSPRRSPIPARRLPAWRIFRCEPRCTGRSSSRRRSRRWRSRPEAPTSTAPSAGAGTAARSSRGSGRRGG